MDLKMTMEPGESMSGQQPCARSSAWAPRLAPGAAMQQPVAGRLCARHRLISRGVMPTLFGFALRSAASAP